MMFKLLFSITLLISYLYSKDIKPTFVIESKGFVNDFIIDKDKLYVANDEGSVEVFNLHTQKLINEIFIDPIYTRKQTWQNSKILSVDRKNDKTLILSNDKGPYRNLWMHDGKNLKHIIKAKDKLSIKEARFISDDKFILGTLGYELALYNIGDNYHSYKKQPEQSSFEDLALSEDKKTMVSSSESGQIILSDVKTGEVIKKYKPLNLDKVYQVAYKNGTVITASQDRKVAVYLKDGTSYTIKSDFLIYSVALSPSANIGVYSSNAESDLQIFNTKTKRKTDKLIGHYAIPTTIKFYDENSLFSAGYENKVFYWRLD